MDPAADKAAAAAAKAKAEQMLALAKKLGVDTTDPAMAFGFMLGCASSTTFRLKQQVRVASFAASSLLLAC